MHRQNGKTFKRHQDHIWALAQSVFIKDTVAKGIA